VAVDRHRAEWILDQFQLYGRIVSFAPFGSGHINDTFASVCDQAGTKVRYVHQRVNSGVFKRPDELMENVERVTAHQRIKHAGEPGASRSHLTLVPAKDGRPYLIDDEGEYWRTYLFVEGAKTHNVVTSVSQAEEAAAAFARFQRDLSDMPGDRPHETIPGFHDSPERLQALESAVDRDAHNRAAQAREEIDFALSRKAESRYLLDLKADGRLPERVTHNDTKINNVMLDDITGRGVCVIDLDTVMPGLVHYDFGDLVRTSTSPTAEDETDLSKVGMRLPMFEALVRGYMREAGGFLTDCEIDELPFAGVLMTLTIGVRFLTDFLSGDLYFKTARPDHNLDRCRTQFALVRSIEQQREEMDRVLECHNTGHY
jgi:Ser/Thr protein kinase RdoA (MazF antagonist)